jgi:hypothetical protein
MTRDAELSVVVIHYQIIGFVSFFGREQRLVQTHRFPWLDVISLFRHVMTGDAHDPVGSGKHDPFRYGFHFNSERMMISDRIRVTGHAESIGKNSLTRGQGFAIIIPYAFHERHYPFGLVVGKRASHRYREKDHRQKPYISVHVFHLRTLPSAGDSTDFS